MTPSAAETAHHRNRRLWSWALLTPMLYVALAWFFEHQGWVSTSPDADHRWDRDLSRWIILLLAASVGIGLFWLRLRRGRDVLFYRDDPDRAIHRWTWNCHITCALADALGFLGLMYFALSGRRWALIAGGVAAYMAYAAAHPSHRNLKPLDRAYDPDA